MRVPKPLLALTCLPLLLAAGCSDDDDDTLIPSGDRVYEVTIENLTSGQPLSPGVLVTHESGVHFWQMGSSASEGLRMIAENGDPAMAVADLGGVEGVMDVVSIDAPIHRMGGPGDTSATWQIMASGSANRISIATMLICTNDGFTGVDSLELPAGFGSASYMAMAYDAGTEMNDELWPSVVDACPAIGPEAGPADGNARPATSGTVMAHPGISGSGDLSMSSHGWSGAVARISIRRVS